ncbi:polygalacturonan/rhamnogalacturonan ABC transporter permease [Paenibacillus vulneris]|uniref:ABC transporter permease n=1 Tax=Paenibacillus vulneris TaxID=1133364 RepID=A0ABW3UFX8_9BACL|nr:ABC transporter permease subunit [Paenibacillus sp. OAS669]MBE1440915.1 putative aldouronate transport system permease protein [Paenibacillus sp. OAS669]
MKTKERAIEGGVSLTGQQANASAVGGVLRTQGRSRFRRNVPLLMMFAPVIVFFIVFRYVPMLGNIIAFKHYNLMQGIWGSPWAGLDYYRMMFSNPQSIAIIRNTFILSLLKIVIGFPFPILIAVMLNEVRKAWFKRSVQTLLYLPHFFSWVIVGGIAVMLFGSQAGALNAVIRYFGGEPVNFLYQTGSWLAIFFGSGIWKEAGFSAIIYLAAISSIDPSLYEAASIDGASKLKQIGYVTLPGIMPVMTLMLIISMGNVMEVGFDQVYNLQNAVVSDVSNVISTYIYTVGIQGGLYSMTTAMGLFEAVIGLVLVVGANRLAKLFDQALW